MDPKFKCDPRKKTTLKLNKNEKKISVLDDIFHVLIINCDI
jgi:hypothetical protein